MEAISRTKTIAFMSHNREEADCKHLANLIVVSCSQMAVLLNSLPNFRRHRTQPKVIVRKEEET